MGLEPATPTIKRVQTYTLDRTATGIGILDTTALKWRRRGLKSPKLMTTDGIWVRPTHFTRSHYSSKKQNYKSPENKFAFIGKN